MGKDAKPKDAKGKGKQAAGSSGGGDDAGGGKGGKGKGGKSADGLGTCTYVKGIADSSWRDNFISRWQDRVVRSARLG